MSSSKSNSSFSSNVSYSSDELLSNSSNDINLLKGEIINNKFNILHTDIKPENILVKGINIKFEQIIKKFQENKHVKRNIDMLPNRKKKEEIFKLFKEIKKLSCQIDYDDIENAFNKKD